MFLKLQQLLYAGGMGDEPKVRPLVVAVGAIDRVEDLSDDTGHGVRITLDGGESLTCLGSIDQVCEAIARLTGGEGLVVVDPLPKLGAPYPETEEPSSDEL